MSRQEKKFFRLHLRVMFFLVFAAFLCQSEDHQKASVTEIKSCSRAASTTYALMKKDNFEQVVKDRSFLFNLLDCTKETHKLIMKTSETGDCKTFDEMIPSEVLVSVMNKKIPEAIKTRSLAAEDQRLILLSVYLVHISHGIRYVFCSANFSTKDIILTLHHKPSVDKFNLELKKNILGFLEATLMAQWKSDNITILEINTDTLINRLITSSTTLIDLLNKISSSIDKTYLESTWWPLSCFKREHKIIAKLYELRTEMDTLKTELDKLSETPVIDPGLLEGLLNSMWESSPTWLKKLLSLIGLIYVLAHFTARLSNLFRFH